MRDFYFLDIFGETLLDLIDSKYCEKKLKEDSDKYSLRVEVPGIKEKDLRLTFEHGTFHLGVDPKYDPTLAATTLYIGDNVDEDNISATLEDGILTVTFPKKNKSTVKTIKISKP